VYFWHDGKGKILYIGKAVNLRARVTSYFSNARRDRRTRDLVERARTIRCEVTSTELDALLRESALIKREQPPFNRALRRSRQGYYLKLDAQHPDPYIEVARETSEDGSLYFGPFHSAVVIREMVAFVHDILPLRKCVAKNPKCRPCLYHQMGTCAAPLLDEAHRRQHQDAIQQLHHLLDGRSDRVIAWLERKRDRLSEGMMYERAAEVHERIETLRRLMARQVVLEAAARCRHVLIRDEGRNGEDVRLLFVAQGRVLGVRSAHGMSFADVNQWVRIHEALAQSLKSEQSELDAASVLEGWVRCNRERVRWVSLQDGLEPDEIEERLSYLLGDELEAVAQAAASDS
jgi:excinuclease ABC subunit C